MEPNSAMMQPWRHTCTIVYDEETKCFQLPEVQPAESSEVFAPRRQNIQKRGLASSAVISCTLTRLFITGDSHECLSELRPTRWSNVWVQVQGEARMEHVNFLPESCR